MISNVDDTLIDISVIHPELAGVLEWNTVKVFILSSSSTLLSTSDSTP